MARPRAFKTSKADMESIVRQLSEEYGLGERAIAKLLGFSQRYINAIRAEFAIGYGNRSAYRDCLLRSIDKPLRDKCQAVFQRSVAAAADCKTGHGSVSHTLRPHSVLDDEADKCVNSSGKVRPVKAHPLPTLADLAR